MGVSNLNGTPWHVERLERSENDLKRSKGRCKYFAKCYCAKTVFKCTGSAHCEKYLAISEKEYNEKKSTKEKKNNAKKTKKKSKSTIILYHPISKSQS